MSRGLDPPFDDHASVAASLEDFEHASTTANSPELGRPARSEDASSIADSDSGGPWSPPGWRRHSGISLGGGITGIPPNIGGGSSSGWYRPHTFLQNQVGMGSGSPSWGSRPVSARQSPSRESSPQYESAREGDVDETMKVPTRGMIKSEMADSYPAGEEFEKKFGGGTAQEAGPAETAENPNNYIRFAVRAEVQHRTEPFEMFFSSIRYQLSRLTKTRLSTFLSLITTILASMFLSSLFSAPAPTPVPDLVKVASLARAFEPMIFYSENGITQIGDLQDTGVAVWDLCESVRSTNMTSAPIIVSALDSLSETLKTLSLELTRFFASVDGDIDGILIVMDWAKRELSTLSTLPATPLSTFLTNTHTTLSNLGILSPTTPHSPPSYLPLSRAARMHRTLHTTFREFLTVLEDAISSELSHSTHLFALFAAIDAQFHNLARTVVRETSAQEREESDLLASLWVRVLGANAAELRKFEKNRRLLSELRARTVRNKGVLIEHNGKLLALKANLEMLRRKLVGPLVRGNASVLLRVEDQVSGLEGTYGALKQARERQKSKLMEMVYGAGRRRDGLGLESIGG